MDRSILNPDIFLQTNILGTQNMLQYSMEHNIERFIHISTDEVYGDLDETGYFTEDTSYAPSSPYSASKAGSDHLVRAWQRTYGLPTLMTNCSNNYGPYQFPEKLIPLVILNALEGKPLPIYGDGLNVRDWLYVEDHCEAIETVLDKGVIGECYNVGGNNEQTNINIVRTICQTIDRLQPGLAHSPCESLITYVTDRPGHDRRYAIDASRIRDELGWEPKQNFQAGIEATVKWYMENSDWVQRVQSGEYRGERLGLGG